MYKKTPHYTAELKAESIKKIADNGGNISHTARELKIPMQTQTLTNWQNKVN